MQGTGPRRRGRTEGFTTQPNGRNSRDSDRTNKQPKTTKAKSKKTTKKKSEKVEVIQYKGGVDKIFLVLVIIMVCVGTAMIFTASYANALWRFGNSYHFVVRQMMMAAIGMVFMVIASYIADHRWIKKVALPIFIAVLVLNYLTPFLGRTIHGGHRWIVIGGLQFQPSELLKLAVVLMLAWYIEKMDTRMRTFKWGLGVPGLIIVAIAVAMFLQSHFSGLIIISMICIAIIFIGETPIKWLGLFAAAGGGLVFYVIWFTDYASSRIESWLDPWADPTDAGFQVIQSLYAIASGGLTGVGLGQSRQKFLYLPEPQNDFIFSIISEELGFIGAVGIILLFVVLIWRGIVIAYHAPDKFSAFVVMGIIIKVAVQFLLNLMVVTGTIPNTGIPLPFFSYGGTALVVLLAEMGIILCISRYSYQEKA